MSPKQIRIFINSPLKQGNCLTLTHLQTHYLLNVMRRQKGEEVVVFNGIEGEWAAQIQTISKKSCDLLLIHHLRPQPTPVLSALIFPPIRHQRLDFMIEKAAELGVTDFYPILTDYTAIKNLNTNRLLKIAIEAVEQSERLIIPRFHKLIPLRERLSTWDNSVSIIVGIERKEIPSPPGLSSPKAILIGPEGGFSQDEFKVLERYEFIHPVSLGPYILRTETTAIALLAICSKNSLI